MNRIYIYFRILFASFILCSLITSCYIFNGYKTALLLTPHTNEILPNVAITSFDPAKSTSQINSYGIQLNHGFTYFFNLGAAYSRLYIPEYEIGYHYLAFNPVFGIIREHLALSTTAGFYFGKNVDFTKSTIVQPTLLLTFPLITKLSLTIAPGATIFFHSFDCIYSLNFNVRYALNKQISILPEIGYAFSDEKENSFLYGGIGISITKESSIRMKLYEK